MQMVSCARNVPVCVFVEFRLDAMDTDSRRPGVSYQDLVSTCIMRARTVITHYFTARTRDSLHVTSASQDVRPLGQALAKNKTLETLYLDGNQISDVTGLAAGLEENESLVTLGLNGNSIQEPFPGNMLI
jgi:Leucine-rich repeat (LRR) protein